MRYLIGIICFMGFGSFGQTIFQGIVLSETGERLPLVNIMISVKSSDKVVAFAVSKQDGSYLVKASTDTDSVILTVSKLNFVKQRVELKNKSQVLDFILEEGAQNLREIKVKAPPVRRFGDTLSYNVSEFMTDSDRTINDVIRKLPGIEVASDGTIKYQGQPINTYYVEGLNLMSGSYGLINENLNVNHVVSVEVLENHQPVRALSSLKISERAAINIRLKKQVVASYAIQYGLGLSPILWEANITPMLFTPKLQMAASYQSNNTGINLTNQVKDLTTQRAASYINVPEGWLSVLQLGTPQLNSSRWMDNNTHISSLNILKKSKQSIEFKLNGALMLDRQEQMGSLMQTYIVGLDSIRFYEQTKNYFTYSDFKLNLSILKNTNQKYFSNNLAFKKEWGAGLGANERQYITYGQNLKSDNYELKNNFHTIFNRKKTTYNLYSNLSYLQQYQNLSVSIYQGDSIAGPIQDYQRKAFLAHNYVEFSHKLKQSNVALKFGNQSALNLLNTDLNGYNFGGNLLVNGLTWNSFRTYFSGSTLVRMRKNGTLFFDLPLSHNLVVYKQEDKERKLDKWVLEPSIFLRKGVNSHLDFILNIKRQNLLAQFGDMYTSPVMTNYLSVVNRDNTFRDAPVYSGTIGLNYQNPVSILFWNLNYSYSRILNNLLSNATISSDGLTEVEFQNAKNPSTNKVYSGRISKYIMDIKLTPTVEFAYIKSINQRIVNRSFSKFENSAVNPTIKIVYSGLKALDADYKISFMKMWNRTNASSQFTQAVSLGFRTGSRVYVRTSFEHYNNRLSIASKDYLFNDLLIRVTLPKRRQDIEISLNNLLNTKMFRVLNVSEYYYSESIYQLRPRQITLRGKIHI